MDEIISTVLAKGDLAHVALFLWAGGASVAVFKLLKELSAANRRFNTCLLYTSPSPRDRSLSRMPSSA